MEKMSVADEKDEGLQELLPSIQEVFQHFQPNCTAQSGGNVVSPSITGSTITNLNFHITSTGQGSIVSSKEASNHDTADISDDLMPQNDKITECQKELKAKLKRKFGHMLEGMLTNANRIPLNKIYTELYLTEGRSGEVNKEHEVIQFEMASRLHEAQEKSIHCNQLFDHPRDRPIRTVITRGVAGIGKTVSANKFTLDWAEGKANTNLGFVFPLSFRELNLMKTQSFSLVKLLSVLFPETNETGIFTNANNQMLFILDGLDESRLSLDFQKTEIVSDVTQTTTIPVLLINLIRGRLLPYALVWITSRPVASSQIPMESVDLVTEVRGFNESQKDEYFRRKISDQNLANRVIAHVKSYRTLHIMCHIPIFCWMAASVLEKKLQTTDSKDTPKSLTQMYIHFLSLYVANMRKSLPERKESNANCIRDNLMSLGKLAFQQLERRHLIFYESDLTSDGIEVSQASLFSGIYTQIFNEQLTLCEEKTFSFVHLSIQEFFAALYVYLTFHNDNKNVLVKKSSSSRRFPFRESSEVILYKEAVEKALGSDEGHFDIFLRFLLGLSLESNQTLLKHLMTTNRSKPSTREVIITHIKERIKESPSPDRCLNFFHCLNELQDHSLIEEIQSYLSKGSVNKAKLSPAQWATLVFVLLTSEKELRVFELSNYTRSNEGLLRLLPVMKKSSVANLNACNLTVDCCKILAIGIPSSQIRELDLGNNNLTDDGINELSDQLKNSKLVILRLKSCNLTERSSKALASVISSDANQLKELDLSQNDFMDVGVKELCVGLGSPHCKLEILILSLCSVTEEGCTFLASALNTSRLKELDLSYNHPGPLGLQLLTALKDDPRCSLHELSVEQCGESRIQPGPKKYTKELTLDPNTAQRDLSLSEGNRKATRWTEQSYPDHPERFDFCRQVLCREGLTGRCYWETEWRGRVLIGVAYRTLCRKGEGPECWLGKNDSSWGIYCTTKERYRIWPGNMQIEVTIPSSSNSNSNTNSNSNKLGVYLDWPAGRLTFFRIDCGAMTLIHYLNTTFTEPVYPGFWLGWPDSTVCLC